MRVKLLSETSKMKTYLIRLEKNEAVMESLKKFKWDYASSGICFVEGIGALDRIRMGYLVMSPEGNAYKDTFLESSYELLSLKGTISDLDEQPLPHIHVSLAGSDFQVIGGHLHEANVSVTVELMINVFEGKISREFDGEIGLNLLSI